MICRLSLSNVLMGIVCVFIEMSIYVCVYIYERLRLHCVLKKETYAMLTNRTPHHAMFSCIEIYQDQLTIPVSRQGSPRQGINSPSLCLKLRPVLSLPWSHHGQFRPNPVYRDREIIFPKPTLLCFQQMSGFLVCSSSCAFGRCRGSQSTSTRMRSWCALWHGSAAMCPLAWRCLSAMAPTTGCAWYARP